MGEGIKDNVAGVIVPLKFKDIAKTPMDFLKTNHIMVKKKGMDGGKFATSANAKAMNHGPQEGASIPRAQRERRERKKGGDRRERG